MLNWSQKEIMFEQNNIKISLHNCFFSVKRDKLADCTHQAALLLPPVLTDHPFWCQRYGAEKNLNALCYQNFPRFTYWNSDRLPQHSSFRKKLDEILSCDRVNITCGFKQVCVHFTQAASVYTANELYSYMLPGLNCNCTRFIWCMFIVISIV